VRVYLKGILQGCETQSKLKRASVKSPWELTCSSVYPSIRFIIKSCYEGLGKNPLAGKRGWTKLKCPSGTLETEVLTGVFNSFNCLMKNVCKAKTDLKFLLSGSFLTRLCMWNMYYEPFKKGTLHFKRFGSVRFIVDSFIFFYFWKKEILSFSNSWW